MTHLALQLTSPLTLRVSNAVRVVLHRKNDVRYGDSSSRPVQRVMCVMEIVLVVLHV